MFHCLAFVVDSTGWATYRGVSCIAVRVYRETYRVRYDSLKVWFFPHGDADRANISGLVPNTQSKHKSPGTVCHTRNHRRNSAETSSETGFTITKQSIRYAPDDGSVLKKCVSGVQKPQATTQQKCAVELLAANDNRP
jgi:hypothetical protein